MYLSPFVLFLLCLIISNAMDAARCNHTTDRAPQKPKWYTGGPASFGGWTHPASAKQCDPMELTRRKP